MRPGTETNPMPCGDIAETRAVPEDQPAAIPTLDPDEARTWDEGVLAEVPYALEAWMSHQCFGHC